jgi:hypothetical protein
MSSISATRTPSQLRPRDLKWITLFDRPAKRHRNLAALRYHTRILAHKSCHHFPAIACVDHAFAACPHRSIVS